MNQSRVHMVSARCFCSRACVGNIFESRSRPSREEGLSPIGDRERKREIHKTKTSSIANGAARRQAGRQQSASIYLTGCVCVISLIRPQVKSVLLLLGANDREALRTMPGFCAIIYTR